MEGPGDAGLCLHPGRGSGGLPECVQAVHRLSRAVYRQARGLLPGTVEFSRDRGDAFRPPARRGLLDRTDRIRGQHGRCGAGRGQGHRERTARLSPRLDRAKGQPLPEALRSQGQARRAYLAVVELGASRAAGALSARRAPAERGLQAVDVVPARQIGTRGGFRRLRHGRRRLRRIRADDRARDAQGRRLSHHLHEPAVPDLVVRPRPRSQSGSRQEGPLLLLRFRLSAVDAEGVQRRRSFFPDHLQGNLESSPRNRRGVGDALQQGGLRSGIQTRGGCAGEQAAIQAVARSRHAGMDASALPNPAPTAVDRSLLIRNLCKEYRAGRPVLKGVSLAVAGRGVTAIIGPSGTGKSTLVRCINRLVDPTAGEILFRGQDLARLTGRNLRAARRRIGMIFQEYNLVERLSVIENVLCGRLGYVAAWRAWLRKFPDEDIERAFQLLDAVGLGELATQRADRPTSSLDPKTSVEIMELIARRAGERDIPVIVNMHNVELARRFADRIVGMSKGEIVFDGSPQALTQAHLLRIYGGE